MITRTGEMAISKTKRGKMITEFEKINVFPSQEYVKNFADSDKETVKKRIDDVKVRLENMEGFAGEFRKLLTEQIYYFVAIESIVKNLLDVMIINDKGDLLIKHLLLDSQANNLETATKALIELVNYYKNEQAAKKKTEDGKD